MIAEITIALLSDLHAFKPSEARKNISNLPALPAASDPNPFKDLEMLIKKEELLQRCDLLICPGDICDQADYAGFQYAWTKLHEINKQIGSAELVATCGNHDLDSRYNHGGDDDPDPKGALQQVTPQFPFQENLDSNHYWARNFVIRRPKPGIRVLVLNTSAFHGGAEGELHHGRVSLRTIKSISASLSEDKELYPINILVCHHHLRPLEGWGTAPDREYVSKGSELLRELGNVTGMPWLVLHGHNHRPNIEHSQAPSYVMFGASSFSKPEFGQVNQFHHIHLYVDVESTHRPIYGKIKTWNWTRSAGWMQTRAEDNSGLPANCGFGFTGIVPTLAKSVSKTLERERLLEWVQVLERHEDIHYLPPAQRQRFLVELEKLNVGVSYDQHGNVTQLGMVK